MGDKQFGHDNDVIERICLDIKKVTDSNIQVCLVIGGGNIFRGVSVANHGVERTSADYIGMLATVMNALTLQSNLEKIGVYTRVLSAIPMMTICETYIRRRAIRHMQKNRVVIFAGGVGNPLFTTDTASVLRAIEMNCDAVLKGTKVDGVYDFDPIRYPNAQKFDHITHKEVLNKELNIMDSSAITIAKDNNMPIIVFSIKKINEFFKILNNTGSYTIIS